MAFARRIKSNGGDGYVKNVVFDHFMGLGTAYACKLFLPTCLSLHIIERETVDIDEFWSDATKASGDGVVLSNITFSVRSEMCLST